MSRASQRHKQEIHPALYPELDSAISFSFIGGQLPGGSEVVVKLSGDSTGPVTVTYFNNVPRFPTALATNVAAAIDAETGFLGASAAGTVNVSPDAPNTTVEVLSVEIYPAQ